jgi:xylulose-5-phosphate/fructose-6-phosphate phosphoketolase
VKERMKDEILANRTYAHEHGMDSPTVTDWRWGGGAPA